MLAPYTAVGLIPSVRGVRRRAEIERNLEHIAHLIAAASWLSSLDLPVRLVAVPEGALQGFTDEVFDLDHATYARETAIDIPGPETRFLADLARQWNVFIMAQAKARATRPFPTASSTSASPSTRAARWSSNTTSSRPSTRSSIR